MAVLISTAAFAGAAPAVTNPPTITVQPTSVKVCQGDPASFTVVATGSGTLTYRWRRNGSNLSDGGNISGATTPTLTINPTLAGSPGTYTVRVTNNWGSVTSANRTLSFETTDTDGDGTIDCTDGCPNDPNKTVPGICGCGVADTDSDGDGTPNCNDGCPNDPNKTAPGICGCGVSDADSDGDGTADCNDGCPNDPNKTAPGICGCGVADADSDGDGTADCNDGCPSDPSKTAPGICGCGVSDADSDGDGTADCNDGCPNDPNKTAPGICGCGVSDADSDGDGAADCNDGCPSDPSKTAPGICGCGVSDADSDGDGTADCNDGCPGDPNKTAPGQCGCGIADTDTDNDGTADCNDGCPADPNKTSPGACGCGVADVDNDFDGVFDCSDNCPALANPGQGDADNDGQGDACDNCPQASNSGQEDCDNDGVGDACAGEPDCNQNGVPDSCDIASGTSVDTNADGVPDDCSNPITPGCFGDGAPISCPCGNDGAFGNGCANSRAPGGANLSGSGNPIVSADTLSVVATDVRGGNPTLALFFSANVGTPHAVNDGVLCTTGAICRLWIWKVFGQQGGISTLSGPGTQTVPDTTGISISQRSADKGFPITMNGETRLYTVWYRDPANFACPVPATSNYTNSLRIIWGL